MTVYFFDSSGIVKRYVSEVGTAWVRGLTDPASGNDLYIAALTGVEVVSAVTRRLRRGEVSSPDAATAITDFRAHYASVYPLLRASPVILAHAMNLVGEYSLRAYDAVQLATALQVRARCLLESIPGPLFISADAALNAAASAEGLAVDDPGAHP